MGSSHGKLSTAITTIAAGWKTSTSLFSFGKYPYRGSAIVDDEVIRKIEELIPLAPLHNPANILGVKICKDLMPKVPNVVTFDTAFHQTMPMENFLYAVPYADYTEHHLRKYGFHGTSHY